jgi:hypothetical protein
MRSVGRGVRRPQQQMRRGQSAGTLRYPHQQRQPPLRHPAGACSLTGGMWKGRGGTVGAGLQDRRTASLTVAHDGGRVDGV